MSEPIWSTGGAGGERAVIEDLDWAVDALKAAARDVASAQAELAQRRAVLELSPDVGHAELAAELGHAASVLGRRLEDDLDDTASRLARVSAAYLAAEEQARHGLSLTERARGIVEDAVGIQQWVARVAGGIALMATPGGVFVGRRVLPNRPPPTTGILDRDVASLASRSPTVVQVEAALYAAVRALEHLLGEPWDGDLTATEITSPRVRSLESAMERLRAMEGQPDGSVRIERWTDDEGVTRRVVYIPGTQDAGFWDANTSDVEADGRLMLLGQLPDAGRVVEAALEADGAKPGEPVMLVGHSLGGIVAVALAGNTEFLRRFDVRAVVTAGSPTGRLPLPAKVNALHLEGTRDITPGADGRGNPDTPTRVTVHHDARRSEVPQLKGAARDIGSAHHLDTYAQTARLVDNGVSPSTDAWLKAEESFLRPGSDSTVTAYRPG